MWLEAIGFFLLSSVKFAVATLPIALRFDFYTALTISILGGLSGAFFFLFLWRKFMDMWNIYIFKNPNKESILIKINKRKRRIINLKNTYGYWGILVLTPVILSIPIGAFLLSQYFQKKKLKFIHLSLSIIIWGIILISFFKFFYQSIF